MVKRKRAKKSTRVSIDKLDAIAIMMAFLVGTIVLAFMASQMKFQYIEFTIILFLIANLYFMLRINKWF